MELMIRRPAKGLDLLPLFQDAMEASVRTKESSGSELLVDGHSLYVIHSVSDISCETDRSIHFLPVFDCAGLTRSPP